MSEQAVRDLLAVCGHCGRVMRGWVQKCPKAEPGGDGYCCASSKRVYVCIHDKEGHCDVCQPPPPPSNSQEGVWRSCNPLTFYSKVKQLEIIMYVPSGGTRTMSLQGYTNDVAPGTWKAIVENHHGWHIEVCDGRYTMIDDWPEGCWWVLPPLVKSTRNIVATTKRPSGLDPRLMTDHHDGIHPKEAFQYEGLRDKDLGVGFPNIKDAKELALYVNVISAYNIPGRGTVLMVDDPKGVLKVGRKVQDGESVWEILGIECRGDDSRIGLVVKPVETK